MNSQRTTAGMVVITIMLLASVTPAPAELKLHYALDGSGRVDQGIDPAAKGTLVGTVAPSYNTPGSFSCEALDFSAAGNNYLTTGVDVDKIDAMPAMTTTFWLYLTGAPQNYDCILSDTPSLTSQPPVGDGGWKITIEGVGGNPPAANSFSLSFASCKSSGSYMNCQGSKSPAIDADHKWVFVAVTFDTSKWQRYYLGSETVTATQIGSIIGFSNPLANNSTEFRIAGDTSAPSTDRTPPAMIDDVRIYDTALSPSAIEAIRIENLADSHPDARPGFRSIRGYPGHGCGSSANGVSSDGSFIVGSSELNDDNIAYRWHDGNWTPLGDLPGGYITSDAKDVSDDGQVVVGLSHSASGYEAFRWENGTMVGLGDIPGGNFSSRAQAVSADGSIVVGDGMYGTTYDNYEAFRWQNNIMTPLGYVYLASIGYDVSADGTVTVGVTGTATGGEACYWDSNGITTLGELPGGSVLSVAEAISADKSTIVGYSNSGRGDEAVMWRDGQMTTLGDFSDGFHQSEARDVSANGFIIVGNHLPPGARLPQAFIWDPAHGIRDLKTVLATDFGIDTGKRYLLMANAVSADGRTIVGDGYNPDGRREAWRVRLPAISHSADINQDNYVDTADMDIFFLCGTGPAIGYNPAALPSGCTADVDITGVISVDFDEDGDVDQDDFSNMQRCYSGPMPAKQECK